MILKDKWLSHQKIICSKTNNICKCYRNKSHSCLSISFCAWHNRNYEWL